MVWADRGRSGIGDNFSDNENGHTWQDFDGLSPNGQQVKEENKEYIRSLSGQAYWSTRKQGDEAFYNIKPEDYPTPAYYHQPKQAKVVPIVEAVEDIEEAKDIFTSSVNTLTQEKKESIFLTLKEDNFFRKIYEKFVK